MRNVLRLVGVILIANYTHLSDSVSSGPALITAPVGTSVSVTCVTNSTDNVFWSYRRQSIDLPETVHTGAKPNRKYVNKFSVSLRREAVGSWSTLTIDNAQLVDAGLFDCREAFESQKTTTDFVVYEATCGWNKTTAGVLKIDCQLNFNRTTASPIISCRLKRSQHALVHETVRPGAGRVTYTANVDSQRFIDDDDEFVTCTAHFAAEFTQEYKEATLWISPAVRREPLLVTIEPTDQRVFTHGDVLTCNTTRDSASTTTTTTYSWIDPTTNNLIQTGSELTLDLCRDLCLNTSDDGKCAVLVEMSVKCLVTTADRDVTTASAVTTFNASMFTNCSDSYNGNAGENAQLFIMVSVIAGTCVIVVIVVIILTCGHCLHSRKTARRKADYSQYEQVRPHNQERVLYTTVTLPADRSISAVGDNTTGFLSDC